MKSLEYGVWVPEILAARFRKFWPVRPMVSPSTA